MATRPAPPPPKLTPKPGHVKVVRALYNYTAQQDDELTFEEGDILYIVDMVSNKDWWMARCGTKEGIVPSNYVEDSMEEIPNPLHEAAKRGNVGFLKEYLNHKVSVNGLDKAGCVPMHWAAHAGHIECVQELLASPGIMLNVQNKLGETPLHFAAWKGHDQIVKLLLDQGCRADIENREGKTPLDLAKEPQTAAVLQAHRRHVKLGRTLSGPRDEDYGSSNNEDSD